MAVSPPDDHRYRCSLPDLADSRVAVGETTKGRTILQLLRGEGGIRTRGTFRVHTISSRAPSASRSPLQLPHRCFSPIATAESVGFEPTVPSQVHLISNQAPSTTRSALRRATYQRGSSCQRGQRKRPGKTTFPIDHRPALICSKNSDKTDEHACSSTPRTT
jgi:hypothetical protein